MVEISGDVTDAGRTNELRTREDRATQPMDAGWLSFAIQRTLHCLGDTKKQAFLTASSPAQPYISYKTLWVILAELGPIDNWQLK